MVIPVLTAVAAVQQLFSLFKPQGSTPTSNFQATNNATQGIQGHPRHKSMADMISNLQSTIDNAVKTGRLTGDQAMQMKKKLDSITQTLNKTQTGSGAQLTPEDLQQIRAKFQEIRKELFDALNPQRSAIVSNGIGGYHLFQKMDANGNRVIDRNEFSNFISTLL